MRYISFSLWGDKPIYNVGTIRNAELSSIIYPDWKMVVYHDRSVPSETLKQLEKLNVLLIDVTGSDLYGMFWRFLASDIDDSEYVIFRDSDSRIGLREKFAVDEWINSGKTLHVMRDHPYHQIPCGNNQLGILGGMWGIKSGKYPMTEKINLFQKLNHKIYGVDQTFLRDIYHKFQNDRFTHDEFFEKKPFPMSRDSGRFIGERIDENEKPVGDDYKYVL